MIELGIWLTKYITVPIILLSLGFLLGQAWEKARDKP